MRLNSNLSIKLLIIFTIFALLLCSCKKNDKKSEPQAKQMQETEKGDKVPEDLEKIESSIEKIIKALEGPAVSLDEEEEEKNKELQKNGQSNKADKVDNDEKNADKANEEKKSGEEEDNDNKNSKNTQEDKNKNEEQNANAPKEPWQEISTTINKLHYEWNAYIPAATKKNASRELIDNFDNSLNNLTSTIVTQDKNNILLAANNLYQYIPDFYMLYKTPSSPEIKRIRYYIRNVVLNASISNWEQAVKDVSSLKSSWAIFKNTLDPQNQNLESQLDYSIYELEKVVNENNVYLTDIKGRIAISNTAAIEKAEKENEKSDKEGK